MRVISYQRVSTTSQLEAGSSLDAQRAKITAYCAALDLTIVTSLDDGGVSAGTLDRPGLHAALALLDAHAADGIVITKLDRLTRSVKDLGHLIERYFGEQFALFSVGDSIDTRSAGGRLVLNVLMSVAQWEREAISERTRDTLGHLRKQGVKMGAAPLGFRYGEPGQDGRRPLIAVSSELETVALIRRLRTEGRTLDAISAELTTRGIPTKRRRKWSAKTVRDVLVRCVRMDTDACLSTKVCCEAGS